MPQLVLLARWCAAVVDGDGHGQCSAGKAQVAPVVKNTDDAAAVALWSPAGSAWFGSVAAGESASKACVARAASATGGTVTVTGESLDGAKTASLNVPDASVDRGP